mmetsp:Transcript_18602/g.39936  ORF Transcript_18602/g.39936 Transcript_18602/m.39936 type:complete len:84 (+) Transcript_18602:56-307(+)
MTTEEGPELTELSSDFGELLANFSATTAKASSAPSGGGDKRRRRRARNTSHITQDVLAELRGDGNSPRKDADDGQKEPPSPKE